jgi:hypothetical protein
LGFAVCQAVFANPQMFRGDRLQGARQITPSTVVQAPERAESIHVQVLENHVHHVIQDKATTQKDSSIDKSFFIDRTDARKQIQFNSI